MSAVINKNTEIKTKQLTWVFVYNFPRRAGRTNNIYIEKATQSFKERHPAMNNMHPNAKTYMRIA